ncbi:MAG: cytochrome c3 family protein [Chloroflexota bacterium]
MKRLSLVAPGVIVLAAVVAVAAAIGTEPPVFAAHTQAPPINAITNGPDAECLACHGIKELSVTLPSGERLNLYIDQGSLSTSVHSGRLICSDCHRDSTSYPHPKREFRSLREYSVAQYELCKRCHFANYTKTLDSVHYERLSQGDLKTPICTDCHGAHNVTRPDVPRSLVSQTCSHCHTAVYSAYAGSVHGAALLAESNPDVPVCTDCHRVHNIQDPLTAEFHVQSVQLCSRCHSDRQVMDKYGISTNVTSTYLRSFHGMSVFLSGEHGERRTISEPVCTDCHGVHDIEPVSSPTSPVIKANLAQTCAKCHTDATPNFPSSWGGHYEPSLQKAPAVFLIRWFYRILIPFIIGGLAVHILLDLWRVVTNR